MDEKIWSAGRRFVQFEEGKIYPDYFQKVLMRFGLENDIYVFDLIPHLKKFPDQIIMHDFDGHFTREGCLIVANIINEFIVENNLLNAH